MSPFLVDVPPICLGPTLSLTTGARAASRWRHRSHPPPSSFSFKAILVCRAHPPPDVQNPPSNSLLLFALRADPKTPSLPPPLPPLRRSFVGLLVLGFDFTLCDDSAFRVRFRLFFPFSTSACPSLALPAIVAAPMAPQTYVSLSRRSDLIYLSFHLRCVFRRSNPKDARLLFRSVIPTLS